MNSAIHLCQSPLPVAPGRLSSASRAHVSLSHGCSLSVSQSSKRSHLVSSPLHMNCRLHRFSEWSKMNEERGKKNNVSGKMKHRPILACAGKCSNAAEGSVMSPLKKLVSPKDRFFENEPDDNEIEALKLYAMAVSKDAPKEAEEILGKERKHWVGRAADGKLLMALVELLLYREKYDEASEKIKELNEVVKDDMEAGPKSSSLMHIKWKKFYLLKAIVESVNEARQELKENPNSSDEEGGGGEDTNKTKERWLQYCRKVGKPHESSDFPAPGRMGP